MSHAARTRWACGCALALPALLSTVPVPLAGQEPVEWHTVAAPDGYLKVWTGGGRLTVTGWDLDSLVVTGAKAPGPGRFFRRMDGTAAKLGFEASETEAARVYADLDLRVPRATTLWIRAASAEVEVRGVSGVVDIFTVSGPVHIADSPAAVEVESAAGRVVLDLSSSDVVRVSAGPGGIEFRGRARDLTLEAVDGAIDAEGPIDGEEQMPRRVALESIDGAIRYAGGIAPGGMVSVSTHGGDVELILDPEVSAAVDIATVEGRIDSEFDLAPPATLKFPGTRRIAELGAGAGEIVVRSYGGDVVIGRRAEP